MRRRCITCRALIAQGSYCVVHARRWAPDPGRRRGRWNMERRQQVIVAQAGRCADCGRAGVPLEVHHRDHDETNDQPGNVVALCLPCHRRAR